MIHTFLQHPTTRRHPAGRLNPAQRVVGLISGVDERVDMDNGSAQLAPNVVEFLDRAGDLVGRIEARRFKDGLLCECLERGMESPIEQIFNIALCAMCIGHDIPCNETPPVDSGESMPMGLRISPQLVIGKFRVDFSVTYWRGGRDQAPQSVVVELDGHAFHDKDKVQRAKEKSRDRYLVKAGRKVLHYTGSELWKDPFAVAYEVLNVLDAVSGEDGPSNLFGLE